MDGGKLETEINRRRTFAIISHPDAGKTTMTEKLLLFGGAIRMAGVVKARKSKKFATSDWMEIEKQRGISVTSSVMRFGYKNFEINLLDTPGHEDFSEDTYRVLTAVDSVLMMIDGVKGVEAQTKKLMQICSDRKMPVMTFINKLDREARPPLDLMSEIEDVLNIDCVPLTWPISSGKNFKGVFDISTNKIRFFQPGSNKVEEEETVIKDIVSNELDEAIGKVDALNLRDDIELLSEAGNSFDVNEYLSGGQTPVFFGSALNNFGVKEFLDTFLKISPKPLKKPTKERMVYPEEEQLSGFIFKIQANMDQNHRDRIAFMRICSGKYSKGQKVFHCRTGKELKLSNSVIFMARDMENVEEAYPGDILGVRDTGNLFIADSLTEGEQLSFRGIPNFSPEKFMRVRLANPLKNKQLIKGMAQLTEEGVAQLFRMQFSNEPILGAVGSLQFDVIKFRLHNEYGAEGIFEPVPYSLAQWYTSSDENSLKKFEERYTHQIALDKHQNPVFLANAEWEVEFAAKKFEGVSFFKNSDMVSA